MNDNHRPADFEELEPPLKAAVDAALAEPIPEGAVERVKARAKRLATTAVAPAFDSTSTCRRSWKTSRPLIASLTAAAAILVLAAAAFLLLNHNGGQVFAQMVEKLKTVNSVRFTTAMGMGKQPKLKNAMFIEGNRIRVEVFGGQIIEIANADRKQALFLNPSAKLAQQMELTPEIVQQFQNPIEQLRRVKSDDAEPIGQEMLKGRRTQVYRLHKVDLPFVKGGDVKMLLWVDVESELPAKIEIRDPDPKSPMTFDFDDFVWNEPLDANLFSLAIPDGYRKGFIVTLPPKEPAKLAAAYSDNPSYPTDGILSTDRVPAQIRWDPKGRTITALLRDPESTPSMQHTENELRQWDVATGKLLWSQRVGGSWSFAATADGKALATVVGYEVQLRDAATGKIVRTWATDEMLSSLEFSPDGKALAASISEWAQHGGKKWGGAQIWDIEQARLLRTIKSDNWPVSIIRYAVDGKHLATVNSSAKLWNVATGELVRIFPGMHTAAFSPDGQTIACHSASSPTDKKIGRIDLYKLNDGSLVRSFASEKGTANSWTTSVAFSPDGRLLVATDWNGAVTLWDAAKGDIKLTITDHKAGVLSAAFSPDGATLVTGSEDKTLRVRKLPAQSR
jgi:WD40 repeat protein/outer membrane lipoprotein-sorting protein